jgi:hypothetical protein
MTFPFEITTSSPANGVCPQDQVPAVLQFPLTAWEVQFAARAGEAGNNINANNTNIIEQSTWAFLVRNGCMVVIASNKDVRLNNSNLPDALNKNHSKSMVSNSILTFLGKYIHVKNITNPLSILIGKSQR